MHDVPGHATRTDELIRLGLTRHELRQRAWRHPYHGVARIAGQDEEHPLLRIQDAAALLPACGSLGAWASLYWQGVAHVDGARRSGALLPVRLHVCAEHRRVRRPGIDPTRKRLLAGETGQWRGLPVTTLARAVYDEMCVSPSLQDAVVVLDMTVSRVAEGSRTSLASVRALVDRHVKTRGIRRARAALDMASERSASPFETLTRLAVGSAFPGLVRHVNRPVFDHAGRLLGIPDLADEQAGVVLESDGATHRSLDRQTGDNRRTNAFEDTGLVVVRVTSRDLHDERSMLARVQAAYARGCLRAPGRAGWSFEPPDWWARSTLAQRWG
ncbi:MAG: hypothetical protein M3419_05010 [Actinomycetota bacterium]|nr:hypothetical protein [Actinomycetota bacterium]